jgi:large subunit ribosomal protein L6
MKQGYMKEVKIPEDVEVFVEGKKMTVKGPKGELSREFDDCRFSSVLIEKKDNKIEIRIDDAQRRKHVAFAGSIAAHLRNMISGVKKEYTYSMRIFYTHFPISVSVKDREIHIKNFLGEKGARIAKIAGEADVKIDKDMIIITGVNKEHVGQTAANIEKACKIKGRDRRVFQDGIYLH